MHADEHVLYSSEFLLDCAVAPPPKMPQLKENGVVDDVAAIEGADILFMQCPIMAVFMPYPSYPTLTIWHVTYVVYASTRCPS